MNKNASPSHRRVLMALGWYDYRLHRGIERYALENDWELYANLARERVLPWGWDGDGILAWLGAGDDLAQFVIQARKPTVDMSFRRPELPFPRVLEDHEHAARLVAEHFLGRGFKRFIFYCNHDNWSYEEREAGFLRAIRSAGHDCTCLHWHRAPEFLKSGDHWSQRQVWLLERLQATPKPVAVFAANDDQAMDVLAACQSGELRVPEDVAVIGAEDYLLAVDSMKIPISSVDTHLEMLGYQACALLDDLMRGKRPPAQPIRVPAKGIVQRFSSNLLAVPHKGVADALRFIGEHFHEPIQVADLVESLSLSNRALHATFRKHLGRTPGQELARLRIDHAKKLLIETDEKVEVIARMCGYVSANTFAVAFKHATDLSPRDYRSRHTPPKP